MEGLRTKPQAGLFFQVEAVAPRQLGRAVPRPLGKGTSQRVKKTCSRRQFTVRTAATFAVQLPRQRHNTVARWRGIV